MTKFLIYGFKPFGEYKKNISEELVKKIKMKNGLKIRKFVLPVVFEKKYILQEIQKYKPDIIIGLGQRKNRKAVEIERKGKNIYQERGQTIKRKINPKGPAEYLLNLLLKKKPKGVKIDYRTGIYVCNFTRYIIMDWIKTKGLETKFMFIHIPQNYNISKAMKILKKIIHEIHSL